MDVLEKGQIKLLARNVKKNDEVCQVSKPLDIRSHRSQISLVVFLLLNIEVVASQLMALEQHYFQGLRPNNSVHQFEGDEARKTQVVQILIQLQYLVQLLDTVHIIKLN